MYAGSPLKLFQFCRQGLARVGVQNGMTCIGPSAVDARKAEPPLHFPTSLLHFIVLHPIPGQLWALVRGLVAQRLTVASGLLWAWMAQAQAQAERVRIFIGTLFV